MCLIRDRPREGLPARRTCEDVGVVDMIEVVHVRIFAFEPGPAVAHNLTPRFRCQLEGEGVHEYYRGCVEKAVCGGGKGGLVDCSEGIADASKTAMQGGRLAAEETEVGFFIKMALMSLN